MDADKQVVLDLMAGRLAGSGRSRPANDPTLFVMDPDLVVRAAHGESIMRLPWFDDSLFVGRQLPDVTEIPARVRALAVDSYLRALGGERCQYAFRSYGHGYSVDARPIWDPSGGVRAVLAVAEPLCGFPRAAVAYERAAERFQRSAAQAEERMEQHRLAGRMQAETRELARTERARAAAERAIANARRLRGGDTSPAAEPYKLTSRETEILTLASHGLTSAEIADEIVIGAGTVRTHFENIYAKLGAADRAAAVATGLRHGLID